MVRKSGVFSLVLVASQFLGTAAAQERPGGGVMPAGGLAWKKPVTVAPAAAAEPNMDDQGQILQMQATAPSRSTSLSERLQAMRRGGSPPEGAAAGAVESSGTAGRSDSEVNSLPSVLKRRVKAVSDSSGPTERTGTAEPTSNATSEPASPSDTSGPVARVASNPTRPTGAPSVKSVPTNRRGTQASAGGRTTGDRVTEESPSAAKLVTLRSPGPTIEIEATGPRAIMIGKPANYHVTVINAGQVPAANVQVRIQLPTWVESPSMESAVGDLQRLEESPDGSPIAWTIPEVAAGARVEMTLQVIPRENRVFELGLEWSCQPVGTATTVAVQQPQLELSVTGPKDARYGETVTLLVTVSNPGTGDAENVNVKLLAGANTAENIPIGTLGSGQQKQIEVQLAANLPGNSKITVEGEADGDLKASAEAELLVRRAELQVAVTAPKRSFTGAPAAFQVKVSNTGNAASDDTNLTVVLPPGAKLDASTEGGKPSAGGMAWRIGTLAPGTERSFEVQCDLTATGENKLDARVTAANGLTASASGATTVQALADLKLVIAEPKGARSVGEEVIYEVTITNRGSKAAEDVNVLVQFSDGIEPLSADGNAAEIADGQVVFEPLGRIAPGQRTVLKVKAKAETAGSHRFRVQVTCDNQETQLVSEGTSRFFGE